MLLYDQQKKSVQKVGQTPPPWKKATNALIEKALGDRADLLRRANALIGEGYGIGACAYLRRLLEDEIDPLMDQLIEFQEAISANERRIEELQLIKAGRDFSAKANAVYDVLPEILRVPGHNPLKSVHSIYSAGMHGLSEEECLEIAVDTVAVLSQILMHLAERPRERRGYVDKIKELERRRKELDAQ
ncbi:MAG: hypothetical protein M3O61_15640 [Gemmatimonadota bacterium]|nr:hypothetical protein [Gemmatimonadota bacterium]